MVMQVTRTETDPEVIGALRLDDILEMPEPRKTNVYREWLTFIDEKHMGQVLIKPSEGTTFPASYRKRKVKVPPRGVRIDRRIAADLLSRYGKHGTYYGIDQATGMTDSYWRGMTKAERDEYRELNGGDPNIIKRYLTHIPDNPADLQEPDFPEFPDVDDDEEEDKD